MGSISISLQDFRDILYNPEKTGVDLYWNETQNGGERAFHSEIGEDFVVEILTSIPVKEYYSRQENDAIRTQIRNTETGEIIEAEPHTKRTQGWEDRLVTKIHALIDCPEEDDSDGEKRISNGEYGRYYFCTNDNCDFIQSLSK
jgi:hypothetical protein